MQNNYDNFLFITQQRQDKTPHLKRADSLPHAPRISRLELPPIRFPENSPIKHDKIDEILQMCENTKRSLSSVRTSSKSKISEMKSRLKKYSDRIDDFIHLQKIEEMPSLMNKLVETNMHIVKDMRHKVRLSIHKLEIHNEYRREIISHKKLTPFKLKIDY